MTNSPGRAGRPLLNEGKRAFKITARFNEEEYRLVQDLEQALGINKTDLIRSRVLQNGTIVTINAKESIRQLDHIGAELGRLGNNVNQLARYANMLKKENILSPVVVERFVLLFENFVKNQHELDISLRKIMRILGS